jgi:hypothetical protein
MNTPTPQERILGIVNNHWQSCAVGAAAQLELADLLSNGPMDIDLLAERTKTHAPSLFRMLRALESTGIFTQVSPRVFANTPMSECLRRNAQGSQWAWKKAMKAQRIPDTDSIEELARFWDTHDLTDFDDQLEEVRTPIFARRKEATVAIALTRKEAATLKRLAEHEGVKEAKLVRNWVREKLRASSSIKPPNKPLQPTAHKRRRG